MNEFTKEELEKFKDDLEFEMDMNVMSNHDFNYDLLNKIKTMIANMKDIAE